eukprot:2905223-Rhodomonas_salina.1
MLHMLCAFKHGKKTRRDREKANTRTWDAHMYVLRGARLMLLPPKDTVCSVMENLASSGT